MPIWWPAVAKAEWAFKPEAANTVYSSWWWAVCCSKHVEPSIKFGIINSITKLHLVGYFYWVRTRCDTLFINYLGGMLHDTIRSAYSVLVIVTYNGKDLHVWGISIYTLLQKPRKIKGCGYSTWICYIPKYCMLDTLLWNRMWLPLRQPTHCLLLLNHTYSVYHNTGLF